VWADVRAAPTSESLMIALKSLTRIEPQSFRARFSTAKLAEIITIA